MIKGFNDPDPMETLVSDEKILHKVEKILKGSLDWIPSPSSSVKIQIMSGKVCLRCKKQNIAWRCQQTFKNKMFDDITQQCLALLTHFSLKSKVMGLHPVKSFLHTLIGLKNA